MRPKFLRTIPVLVLGATLSGSSAAERGDGWRPVAVPGTWEETAGTNHDGIAWYRCVVAVPTNWLSRDVTLAVESVDNAHEAWFNGVRIGAAGRFPPDYQNGLEAVNRYVVPPAAIRFGSSNLVAIRVYDHEGKGGFKGAAPQIGTDQQHIPLEGKWQFRTGDDLSWAASSTRSLAPGEAAFANVLAGPGLRGSGGHKMSERGHPLPPAQAAKSFTVPEDLEFEQVLAEPFVTQPVFLNFDERGRMWVVEYRQYPAPAGLNVVSKDVFWRAVYDKVPEPPPRGVKGLDRISIHEDTDGDGDFDKHKVFVDGLNIATSCARGRGGVWVLNPPYLLFYPDANDDDVPDGDPIVHLEGFGLEDTHSVVNSLRWGPDGWLYAAQGSTVTANVRRPGDTNVFYSQGQNIWRYHPETRQYEVFAEGGGNAFGVEIDNAGRIFSGHNGGDTRGFHYDQGAYLRKGFEKHGELSNPYAFGYFPQMTGTPGERFTHNFIIYSGGALPARYDGKLFGVEPLQGRVVLSEITPEGSTFRTRDLERVVTNSDSWFRPVDIKLGPDGAIYVADWYDRQVTHTRNQEGNIDTSNGRIYRLKRKEARPLVPFNLAKLSSAQLVATLAHTNQWFRQTALRLLADRRDPAVVPALRNSLEAGAGSLEALWALNVTQAKSPRVSGLSDELAEQLLFNGNRQVQLWTARLMGDGRQVSTAVARKLFELAGERGVSIVFAQLASTARRLPAKQGLPIVAAILGHRELANDPRIPLLCWWAIESKCDTDRDDVLRLFDSSPLWNEPMVEKHLLERLMRRFAAAGTRKDLLTCAKLLELSPSERHSQRLMKGFEEAFKGRSLAGLPDELVQAMGRRNVGSPAFRLRRGDPEAVVEALRIVADPNADVEQRLRFVEVLGEVKTEGADLALLALVESSAPDSLRRAALTALLPYDLDSIGERSAALFGSFSPTLKPAALTLLASRSRWSRALARKVDEGAIAPADVPRDVVAQLRRHRDPELSDLVNKLWPPAQVTTAEMQANIQRLGEVVQAGKGDPYAGQKLFNSACASCHTLFARGGKVGPDLTTYQRGDFGAMLVHIVNPSAEIREGYENYAIETTDERSLTGFLVERDGNIVVIRGPDGQNITLERKVIAEMRAAGMSLMPEGLLDGLTDQQVRDLFAYLRSTQPLAN